MSGAETNDSRDRPLAFGNTKHLVANRERRKRQLRRILLIAVLISLPAAAWICFSIFA